LVYFCTTKLPKAKRERIEEVKNYYKETGWLQQCLQKIPTWKQRYTYMTRLGFEMLTCQNIINDEKRDKTTKKHRHPNGL